MPVLLIEALTLGSGCAREAAREEWQPVVGERELAGEAAPAQVRCIEPAEEVAWRDVQQGLGRAWQDLVDVPKKGCARFRAV